MLKNFKEIQSGVIGYGAFIVIVMAIPLFVSDLYYLQIAAVTGMFAYLALTWNLVGGFAHQVSFGHAAFVGAGAYTSTLLFITFGITPWIGMFIGAAISVILALLIGFPSFRLIGAFFSLSTLALAEVIRILVTNTENFLIFNIRGAAGLLIPLKGNAPWLYQFPSKTSYYYIIWIMTFILLFVSLWIKKSKYGLFLAAIADDEEAAQANGVSVINCKVYALVISAFFAALGGTFYAQFYRFIDPSSILSVTFTMEIVLIAIVGGSKYVWGPILGAVILTPIGELIRMYLGGTFAGIHRAIFGLLLVMVILFIPDGLASIPDKIIKKLKRKKEIAVGSSKGVS